MNREQAQAEAAERNRKLPNGADHHWMAHRVDEEDWQVVRLGGAGMRFASGDQHTVAQPREDPAGLERQRQDPRPWISRTIPPYGPGGA
jgi:hypothetical protein